MMRTLCVLGVCSLLASCVSYAGVAVAPNGMVWIVRNTAGLGGSPVAHDVLACVVRGPDLVCSRVGVRGVD